MNWCLVFAPWKQLSLFLGDRLCHSPEAPPSNGSLFPNETPSMTVLACLGFPDSMIRATTDAVAFRSSRVIAPCGTTSIASGQNSGGHGSPPGWNQIDHYHLRPR